MKQSDEFYMKKAIALARIASSKGEIPVGAVIVRDADGEVISEGCNQRESLRSATAHAEILAVERACERLGGWRLSGCSIYVTLEPCPMCAGALINSRISRVVFGASDAVAGCCGSVINFNSYPFNHSFSLTSGVCEGECRELLQNFFRDKRKNEY